MALSGEVGFPPFGGMGSFTEGNLFFGWWQPEEE